ILYLLPEPLRPSALLRPVCPHPAAQLVLGLHLVPLPYVRLLSPRCAVLQSRAQVVGGVRRVGRPGVLPAQPRAGRDDARFPRLGLHPAFRQQSAYVLPPRPTPHALQVYESDPGRKHGL
ncbi:hypothetical protein OC844_000040, partial [Tilletia horrida]